MNDWSCDALHPVVVPLHAYHAVVYRRLHSELYHLLALYESFAAVALKIPHSDNPEWKKTGVSIGFDFLHLIMPNNYYLIIEKNRNIKRVLPSVDTISSDRCSYYNKIHLMVVLVMVRAYILCQASDHPVLVDQ